ncbi:cell number regulator 10 isoform X1 [Glycine max]|uniref:cell number regulator 10 isoform X1 n=1 Tax=Glycine max TaxID=3847 RepID=UPI001B354785|nr:cell number regulator 10 isoform X1 [Glycine max]
MYEAASSDPRKPSAPATGFPVSYSTSTTEAEVYSYSYGPVVVPVPPPHPKPIVEWSTGLCDCFSDWGNSCMTFWCPCVTFGRVAEIVDRGSPSCVTSGAIYSVISAIFFVIGVRWWCGWGWGWVYSCFYRSYMRQQYDLRGNACTDCLIHFFCEPCALCQEYRELQFRGFHMTIGIYHSLNSLLWPLILFCFPFFHIKTTASITLTFIFLFCYSFLQLIQLINYHACLNYCLIPLI